MAFDYEEINRILKADPLGRLTRRERTMLLLMSVIAIGVTKVGLVPTRIVGFGIEFSSFDHQAILWLLAAIVFYFLVTFLSYAVPDFLSWQLRYKKFEYELEEEEIGLQIQHGTGYKEASKDAIDAKYAWGNYEKTKLRFKRATLMRIGFDLGVPVFVALSAIVVVVIAAWCQPGAKTP